jgi:hypothetical protein
VSSTSGEQRVGTPWFDAFLRGELEVANPDATWALLQQMADEGHWTHRPDVLAALAARSGVSGG